MNPTPGLRIGLKFATLAGLTLLVAAQPPQVAYAQKTAAPRTFDELRERCRALGIAIPARIETVGPAALARATTPEELRAVIAKTLEQVAMWAENEGRKFAS